MKNYFEIKETLGMVFLQALAWKTSGFHIRYRFKEYRGGPQADHLSSVLTYLNIPKEYGDMYGNYEWNAEW